jgi:hypothetical protein
MKQRSAEATTATAKEAIWQSSRNMAREIVRIPQVSAYSFWNH